MPKKKWVIESTVDIGTSVYCDICNEEWTNRPDSGGFLLQSKAVCPACSLTMLEQLQKFNETGFIRGYCPKDKSFAQWCLILRGGDNTIKTMVLKDTNEQN